MRIVTVPQFVVLAAQLAGPLTTRAAELVAYVRLEALVVPLLPSWHWYEADAGLRVGVVLEQLLSTKFSGLLTAGPEPEVAVAKVPVPALLGMLAKLFGTVFVTVAWFKRPRIQ